MKKIFSTLIVALSFVFLIPSSAHAAAVINVGGKSMCKPIGEIVLNNYLFSDKAPSNQNQSVTMPDSEFTAVNGTIGYVTVRGLASNTGDAVQSVPISITNNGGTVQSQTHTFTVTVNGSQRTVTLNTAPYQTTVSLVQTYSTKRTNMDGDMNDVIIGTTGAFNVTPSATGNQFGSDFNCLGYGTADYAAAFEPADKGFEQGILNVFRVQRDNSNPTTSTCDINFNSNPSSTSGNSSTLTWTSNTGSSNCVAATSCIALNNGWSTNGNANSSTIVYNPNNGGSSTSNYQIRCSYPDGTTKTEDTTVNWQNNNNQSNDNCPVNLDATPSTINAGGNIGLNWIANSGSSCTPANYCFADDNYGWGNGQLSNQGYRTYNAPQSLSSGQLVFRVKCYYPDGSIRTDEDYVNIQSLYTPPVPPNPYTNPGNGGTSGIAGSPIVRTLIARSIEKKSAKLRGYFNANGCPSITTWFEYSTDRSNLEFRSDGITQANKYGNVEFVATNLKAGTKYYYRIVGENCKGTSLGAIESFRTASGSLYSDGGSNTVSNRQVTTTSRATVVKSTNVVDTSIVATGAGTSYLRLDVTNDNDIPDDSEPTHTVIRGEVIVYRVVWENLTTSMLRDGKIRVNLPKALTYMNSSNGIYDKDSHSVYMTIGDIAGRASGVEFITVQVTTGGELGDPVIVEAVAAFDAPDSDAQVNATDFDEDVLGDRNIAAASAPYFGNWMWIIGLILLLILVFLIARYHTLASQYRDNRYGGSYPPNNYQPIYTAPVAQPRAPEPERDPFVAPASLPRDEGGPVYKPFNPNS